MPVYRPLSVKKALALAARVGNAQQRLIKRRFGAEVVRNAEYLLVQDPETEAFPASFTTKITVPGADRWDVLTTEARVSWKQLIHDW